MAVIEHREYHADGIEPVKASGRVGIFPRIYHTVLPFRPHLESEPGQIPEPDVQGVLVPGNKYALSVKLLQYGRDCIAVRRHSLLGPCEAGARLLEIPAVIPELQVIAGSGLPGGCHFIETVI